MVIQRGGVESWGLQSETGDPLQHQLIIRNIPEENESDELHKFSFHNQECHFPKSASLLQENNEADTVPQFCRNFAMTPLKKIKLEPQEWVEWKNTLNVRQATLAAIPTTQACGNGSTSTCRGKYAPEKGIGGPIAAVRALDLLRQNLQKVMNQEIDLVISRYIEKFFQPAVENIKDNLGPECVTQEMLRRVCRQVLEEAKMMYSPLSSSQVASDTQQLWKAAQLKVEKNKLQKLNVPKVTKLETQTTQASKRKLPTHKLSSPEHECAKKKQKCVPTLPGKVVPIPSTKTSASSNSRIIHTNTFSQEIVQLQPPPNPLVSIPCITKSGHTAVICDPPNKSKSKELLPVTMCPKWDSAKWDASRIMPQTLFVMGSRANKALGFGQMRGRLYIKHPELFKYSSDPEDKEWLSRNHLMPPTGGKAYLMIVEDIRELAETEEYKNNPNLLMDEIHGFEAPNFMLRKIRSYVNTLKFETSNLTCVSAVKVSCAPKGKVQQVLSKKILPPVIKAVTCQSDKKASGPKKDDSSGAPVQSILMTKLSEDKSPLSSPLTVQTSVSSTSTTNPSVLVSSVSSSTTDEKITLKSLLERNTTFQV